MMATGRLRAGSASVNITPDGPVPMSGYGIRENPSTGVHDPLTVTTIVVTDGATTVAVVSADLLNVSRELSAGVRKVLAARDIPIDELVLAATHTHAGPYGPARAIEMDSGLSVDADVSDLLAGIETGIVESVATAHERLEPATIRIGRADERDAQHNRRAVGGVGGNVRMPSGSIDSELSVLLVETESSAETVLFNFACHPVCTTPGERLLSADWPGYARRRVAEMRDGAEVLFLNGAAGDINPVGSAEPRADDEVYEYMERLGTAVGDAVLDAVADAEATRGRTDVPVIAECADLSLPVKEVPPRDAIQRRLDDLTAECERLETAGDEVGYEKVTWDRRYATELLDIANWGVDRLPAALRYVEVGPVGLLGMPGEVFVRHGLDFKAAAAAETLMPVGYADDYVGYLPTLAELENGGYEVRKAKLAPEAIAAFREAAFDLVS